MKVIFIKDLKKQSKKGEIKEVKDGYAKNYLIKNGYAVMMNEKNLGTLAKEKQEAKEEDSKNREEALDLKEKLEKEEFLFKVKTGEGDRVFGSVSPKQLKDELHKKGYKIETSIPKERKCPYCNKVLKPKGILNPLDQSIHIF